MRTGVIVLTLLPLVYLADFHGLTTLGFQRTVLEEEFKVRPDYASGTMFVAHR